MDGGSQGGFGGFSCFGFGGELWMGGFGDKGHRLGEYMDLSIMVTRGGIIDMSMNGTVTNDNVLGFECLGMVVGQFMELVGFTCPEFRQVEYEWVRQENPVAYGVLG